MEIRYTPNREGIGEASVLAAAAPQIRDLADEIAANARTIAAAEKHPAFANAIRVEVSTRPKGRGEVKVIADLADGEKVEFGDNSTSRRRVLGRAAGVSIYGGKP